MDEFIDTKGKDEQVHPSLPGLSLIAQLFARVFLGWPAEKANNRIEKVSNLGAETTKKARFKLYNS